MGVQQKPQRFRIAVPVMEGRLAANFEHCKEFEIIDAVNQRITHRKLLIPPLIDPWILPHWLQQHDVDIIIAGSINEKTVGLIEKAGIKVVTGMLPLRPEEVAVQYLTDHLVTKQNADKV